MNMPLLKETFFTRKPDSFMRFSALALIIPLSFLQSVTAQNSTVSLQFDPAGSFSITGLKLKENSVVPFPYGIPLYSIIVDDNFYQSYCSERRFNGDTLLFTLADSITGWVLPIMNFSPGLKYVIRLRNMGRGDHRVENLVPLGESSDKVYITADGTKEWPQYLCRSKLYRPGYGPVGVVLPDNVWHLGFADFRVNDSISLTALTRRSARDTVRTSIDRWSVTLKPGGWIEYNLFADIHIGDWHEGLKMMFQDRWLYDLMDFDTSLFNRPDLKWMRSQYIMELQFAWDKTFYNYKEDQYKFYSHLFEYDALLGGIDIFTLWPTWPRLGLDQRNQWDMYRDLPGGLSELKKQVDFIHSHGKKYFISYNPWDEGTHKEDQLGGMTILLKETGADGVVLDTRGASSKALQAAADAIKPGIIMYSEGMAIPRDMPGIVSGRVHDALVNPPPLNLNKFIKPDFAIFRVLQLADDRLHRELVCSFFNGYGVEINTMRPGRPDWIEEEFEFLGKTTKILRENDAVFHNDFFFPLISTLSDSIYVNRWESDNKLLYTILSLKPEGYQKPLFEIDKASLRRKFGDNYQRLRFIDLWNHTDAGVTEKDGKMVLSVPLDPFNRTWLNTRREGNAGCLIIVKKQLEADLTSAGITFDATTGTKIIITGDNPDYKTPFHVFLVSKQTVKLEKLFHAPVRKVVIQLFNENELLDEVVLFPGNRFPRLITRPVKTSLAGSPPGGMVEIPGGEFRFSAHRDPSTLEPFIPFPDFSDTTLLHMPHFFMDRYPVTNEEFYNFIISTGYQPKDTTAFLRHWKMGKPIPGEEKFPVVFVSQGDASAYATWKGKRLPTEQEWQYAAQGNDFRRYPWGNTFDSTRCNTRLNHPTPVNAFPSGASPFGVEDMIGNVWQLTADQYENEAYYFTIIRGGSYYHPTQSIWYVTGGPLPVDHPEMLLLMAPSLNRNGTVGFRCVMDAEQIHKK